MIKNLKTLIKSFFNSIGYDLYFHRLNPTTNDAFQLYKTLDYLSIDTVFDLGANVGQFAKELRSVGYTGRIISFEPLSEAHQKLLVAASHDPEWLIHPVIAIGDFDGETEINVSSKSVSSSLLPMLNLHKEAAEESAYIRKEKVKISQLDSIASKYLNGLERYFIKIDTQGFEWQVLDGASKTLANSQGVFCELSLVDLYEGQRLWLELIKRLESEGFILWALQKGFIDKRNGRALQLNGIFIRPSMS